MRIFSGGTPSIGKAPVRRHMEQRPFGLTQRQVPVVWTAICCTGAARYPPEETLGAFEQLRKAGSILSWGVSSLDEKDLDDARRAGGKGRLACNHTTQACA